MILSLGMIMFSGIHMEPHAYVEDPPDTEESMTIVVEEALLETESVVETEIETVEESQSESEEETDEEIAETEDGLLSEDGNLTLKDDILTEESEGLQYITVSTRNGNTFYMVIDRTKDTNNVYFLNQVDETDLMSIVDENQLSGYDNTSEEDNIMNNVTMETKETNETEVFESVHKAPDTQKDEFSLIPVITGIVIAIPAVGIGAYLFGKMNGERTKNSLEEDLEFYDDAEYENEDQDEQQTK